ncbi:MAG: helicase-related protein [Akkermansia sp.]|nr:helicase-related protein [Akkermansia sp.]MDU7624839.1 helicase-related protein [Akkermansia sp.]
MTLRCAIDRHHFHSEGKERMEALKGFKAGKYEILVATDVAARGIDISGVNEPVRSVRKPKHAAPKRRRR